MVRNLRKCGADSHWRMRPVWKGDLLEGVGTRPRRAPEPIFPRGRIEPAGPAVTWGAVTATNPSLRRAVGSGSSHETRAPDVETASSAYAARFAGPVGAWMLEVQADRVIEMLAEVAPAEPLRVLEVGGGHGQLTGALVAAGHHVVVHGSRPSCHAQRRCTGERVQQLVSGLWALPVPDRSFDLVAGIRLLAHVESWRELVAEMGRVAARFVLVDFPVRAPVHRLAPALFVAKRHLEGNTRPYFDYAVPEVRDAFAAAGFTAIAEVRQFSIPMVLHRSVGRPDVSRWLERSAERIGLTRRLGSPMLMLAGR